MKTGLIIGIYFALVCCREKIQPAVVQADLSEAVYTDTTWFADCEIVFPETTDRSLISMINKIVLTPERIFLFDIQDKKILLFTRRGKFITDIRPHGRGPGEWLGITDFTVDETDREIIVKEHAKMQMSRLRYDRLSYDTSGLLGPPGRWLLWFHGCCRSCPGCIAADWNNADAEYELSFQTLTRLLDAHPDAEGITISGGEPFGQSAFLADLTEHLHRHGLGIIVYTGFTLSELRAMKEPAVERVLAVTDTLIDGPYRAELDDGKAFRGSANQVIHHLTPRYRAYFSVPAERRTTIQKNGGVYSLTGIPTERAKEEWLSLHRKLSKGEMIP